LELTPRAFAGSRLSSTDLCRRFNLKSAERQRAFGALSRPPIPAAAAMALPAAAHLDARPSGAGLADELQDRGYLIVDGIDGRAHYLALGGDAKLSEFPAGGIVEARPVEARAVDKAIVTLAEDGVYRCDGAGYRRG
jgi:hypothetical protein